MTTLGFTNAGGEFDDFSSSASSDYSSIVSDTAHTEDVGASWAWEDEEGELGTQHRYSRTVNNQSGSQTLHYQSDFGFTNSRTDGYDFHIDRHLIFTVDWIHHDSATSDDGDVTRSVFDERTTDHTGQYDRERHGGSRGMIATEYTTLSGGSTVSIETVTRGGYLYSTGGVGNPDSITQHYSEDGWWNVVDSNAYDDDTMAPYTWDATNTGTIVNEYENDYSRPEPQEGSGAGGGEDDGLDFTVLQYLWTNQLHSFLTDADGEYASVESETESSRTLTGDNAYLATSHTDYTATPHPSEGGGGGSGGGSGGGGGEAEPVTWSESSSEEGTFESPGWPINSFDTTERAFVYFGLTNGWDLDMPEDGRTAAPTLDSTFSNTLSGPAAAAGLRDGAAHTKAYDTDKPVQDNVPPAAAPDAEDETAGDDDCGCGCGDDPWIKKDKTQDEVGTVFGDEVYRDGFATPKSLVDVEAFDTEEDNPTPEDWDAFFSGGTSSNDPFEGLGRERFYKEKYLDALDQVKRYQVAIDKFHTDPAMLRHLLDELGNGFDQALNFAQRLGIEREFRTEFGDHYMSKLRGDIARYNAIPESSALAATQSLAGAVTDTGVAIVSGDAGRALGARSVGVAEALGDGQFEGGWNDWARFWWNGITGEFTGANTAGQALGGADLVTEELLSREERIRQGVIGGGSMFLVGASQYGAAMKGLGKAATAADRAVCKASTMPAASRTLYRAIGEAEWADIVKSGQLRPGPNGYEAGKLFADSLEGAHRHGSALYATEPYRIIRIDIPFDSPGLIQFPNLDGFGPATFVPLEGLQHIIPQLPK